MYPIRRSMAPEAWSRKDPGMKPTVCRFICGREWACLCMHEANNFLGGILQGFPGDRLDKVCQRWRKQILDRNSPFLIQRARGIGKLRMSPDAATGPFLAQLSLVALSRTKRLERGRCNLLTWSRTRGSNSHVMYRMGRGRPSDAALAPAGLPKRHHA